MFFFLRLNPPRPTFPGDITDAENAVMERHATYLEGQMPAGKIVVYGPVMDPKGVFGIAIVEVESEDEVRDLIANDPATTSGLLQYDCFPMRAGAVRG